MKKIVLSFILTLTCFSHAASIRQPQMPRGLTADKTAAPLPNSVSISSGKEYAKKKNKKKWGLKFHTFSEMGFDELKEAKEKKVAAKDWDIAVKYLDRMIKLCDNVNQKASLMIELADILFNQGKYEEASKWFSEFTQLYPGNPKIEYASYKVIMCASKQILPIDRDQSATEKALSLAQDFLKRDLFTTYKNEIHAVCQLCQETLAQSDCYVAQFYLNQKSYAAAERRLSNLRTDWSGKVPAIEIPLATLELALANEYPSFKAPQESIVLAQAAAPIKKNDMTMRF